MLFLCVHNAGRSQMALGWFNHLAAGRAIAWSGGSEPGSELNQDVVKAMSEVGIDISQEFPKPWTDEFLGAADVVVTMGCGDACPLVPGKRYEDWELEDPTGKSLEQIRPIREAVKERVETLLGQILVSGVMCPDGCSHSGPRADRHHSHRGVRATSPIPSHERRTCPERLRR